MTTATPSVSYCGLPALRTHNHMNCSDVVISWLMTYLCLDITAIAESRAVPVLQTWRSISISW